MIKATIYHITSHKAQITQYSQSSYSHNDNQKEGSKLTFPLPFTIPLFSFPLSFFLTYYGYFMMLVEAGCVWVINFVATEAGQLSCGPSCCVAMKGVFS